jgi:hypothetical protein
VIRALAAWVALPNGKRGRQGLVARRSGNHTCVTANIVYNPGLRTSGSALKGPVGVILWLPFKMTDAEELRMCVGHKEWTGSRSMWPILSVAIVITAACVER